MVLEVWGLVQATPTWRATPTDRPACLPRRERGPPRRSASNHRDPRSAPSPPSLTSHDAMPPCPTSTGGAYLALPSRAAIARGGARAGRRPWAALGGWALGPRDDETACRSIGPACCGGGREHVSTRSSKCRKQSQIQAPPVSRCCRLLGCFASSLSPTTTQPIRGHVSRQQLPLKGRRALLLLVPARSTSEGRAT